MTNYFGKARLIKLFYHYISDRTEFLKSFKAYDIQNNVRS